MGNKNIHSYKYWKIILKKLKTMKNIKNINFKIVVLLGCIIFATTSCERGYTDDVSFALFPNNGDIYLDGFTGGLDYYPYTGTKQDAFTVDEETKYSGSSAMRFDIPNEGDPNGSFAGASFILGDLEAQTSGRNLSEYDALTFYAKATQAATLDNVGFGQDFGENKYEVNLQNVPLTTNWVKYIIPIPDASKLIQERGMFWYSEGPENGAGYTFWVDELQFETLGTIGQIRGSIQNGQDDTTQGFIGSTIALSNLSVTSNLASGQDVITLVAPAYFSFHSSNPFVASVNEYGVISVDGVGVTDNTSLITARLGGIDAQGSLTLEAVADYNFAPTPTLPASSVISIFSDAYVNIPIDFFNGYWEPFQTTESADFVVNGDNILSYTNFNFVGHQFSNPTVDATTKSNLHINMLILGEIAADLDFLITIKDFGPDQADGGGDDSTQQVFFYAADFTANEWSTLEIPITLANKNNIGQIIYENINNPTTSSIDNFYLDNIYFY